MLLPSLDDRGRSRFSFRSFQHKVKYLMVITYHSGTGLYQHHFPLMNSIIIILMREVIVGSITRTVIIWSVKWRLTEWQRIASHRTVRASFPAYGSPRTFLNLKGFIKYRLFLTFGSLQVLEWYAIISTFFYFIMAVYTNRDLFTI